jgi:hypothetical protein
MLTQSVENENTSNVFQLEGQANAHQANQPEKSCGHQCVIWFPGTKAGSAD